MRTLPLKFLSMYPPDSKLRGRFSYGSRNIFAIQKWLKSEPLSGSVSHFIFILEKWLTFEPPYNPTKYSYIYFKQPSDIDLAEQT